MKSRSYLGLLTYYAKFLPDVSTVLAPLYQLLKKESQRHWSAKEEKAFNKSKELLTSFKLLVHFDASLLLTLACDASAYGVGAVLPHRMPDGSERPIGYASRTLPAAERNYSQIEKEGLACVFGVKHFHSYLFGHSHLADSPVTADHFRSWTQAPVLQYIHQGWPDQGDPKLMPFSSKREELSVHEACILWGSWVVVPQQGCESVLQQLHEGHPEVTRMKLLA